MFYCIESRKVVITIEIIMKHLGGAGYYPHTNGFLGVLLDMYNFIIVQSLGAISEPGTLIYYNEYIKTSIRCSNTST